MGLENGHCNLRPADLGLISAVVRTSHWRMAKLLHASEKSLFCTQAGQDLEPGVVMLEEHPLCGIEYISGQLSTIHTITGCTLLVEDVLLLK